MCVKWGFDNNKKHTKEGHDNPQLFIARKVHKYNKEGRDTKNVLLKVSKEF